MLAIAHTAPSSPSGVMYSLKHVLFSLVLTRVIKEARGAISKKGKWWMEKEITQISTRVIPVLRAHDEPSAIKQPRTAP